MADFDALIFDLEKVISLKKNGKSVSFKLDSNEMSTTDYSISGKSQAGILKNPNNPWRQIESDNPSVPIDSDSSFSDVNESIEGSEKDLEFTASSADDYSLWNTSPLQNLTLPPDFTLPDGSDSDDESVIESKHLSTVKVYIQNNSSYNNIKINSQMMVKDVIKVLLENNSFDSNDPWALFDVCTNYGIGNTQRIKLKKDQ